MTDLQGWEFALFLFRSSLFRSKSLFLKSNCERFALYRRVMRANWSRCSLKKSDVSDWLVICSFALKKRAICSIKFVFLTVFTLRSIPHFQEGIAILLFRSQKTSDALEKTKSEFPTLQIWQYLLPAGRLDLSTAKAVFFW